ncbi:helix-turn-helix domain-containing protein [Haloarculaceae archaeon H-GB1-1]|nr:helix-turn-helix domain-containing protein [Haloarculaceae archaeon H-GB1-1]
MPVIADVHVRHPDIVLAPTIRDLDDVSIQVVADSSTDPETRLFSFLVATDDFDAFEETLSNDRTVGDWHCQARFGRTRIYQITYAQDIKLVSPKATEVGGLTLEANSAAGGWDVQLQLPDRQALADLYDYCEREGIDLDVKQVFSEEEFTVDGPVGVTEPQREALVTAFEMGYFKQPRNASLSDLADELGISSTAAGGRLRRGMENLVQTTLVDE